MARQVAGEGNIRTVSGMLGHADPGFTLRTYTHTSNPMQVKAAETIGRRYL